MAQGSHVDPIRECLEHLMDGQTHQEAILVALERRPVVDLQGIERRLDDLQDLVVQQRPEEDAPAWWWAPLTLGLALLVGYVVCWSTVQYLPGSLLPPGFQRTIPVLTGKT